MSRNPRVECECKGFIANKVEMDMALERLERKKQREKEAKKTTKIVQVNT